MGSKVVYGISGTGMLWFCAGGGVEHSHGGDAVGGDLSDLTDNSVTRRQPLQPLKLPSTPVYDPEKLRLIEDAEDWRPRTGTSQSRSFLKLARLTGTDGSKFPQGLALPGCPGV